MIADALGWRLTEILEKTEPMITQARVKTPGMVLEPGTVSGSRSTASGLAGDRAVIELTHSRLVAGPRKTARGKDEITIEGRPPIHVEIAPPVDAASASVAFACNMIPIVMKAAPGLVAMTDLPVPRAVAADMRLWLQRDRPRGRLL
jgi:hypothetical protein